MARKLKLSCYTTNYVLREIAAVEFTFQKVRDELIYCFANGILDEEEFVLLYDAYKSIESQRRKLFQLLESCWSCWPGYLIGKGLVSRNNMAAAKAILQELYFRGIDPLKYVLSHRYGWRFCSSVSSNGNQLQGDTREETEGESPAGKMLALVVSSLRVDCRVLSSGLGMGRRFVYLFSSSTTYMRGPEFWDVAFFYLFLFLIIFSLLRLPSFCKQDVNNR